MTDKELINAFSRAIVSAVSALETNPITGDKTALAVLGLVLESAENACGFSARRAPKPISREEEKEMRERRRVALGLDTAPPQDD